MRWRRSRVLAGILGLALAVPAGPVRADLFGDLLGGLFGEEGGGGGGGGCAPASRQDLLGGLVGAASLAVTAVAGGAAGVAGALGAEDGQPGGADQASGHCLVEHEPFQVQDAVEAANRATAFDTVPALADGLTALRDTVTVPDGLPWEPAAADTTFQERYPEEIAPDIAAIEGHKAEQERLARQGSRASKRATAEILADIDQITAQMTELQAQSLACEGVTCGVQINTQMVALQARLIAAQAMMAAAAARAHEGQLDYWMGAVARGRANAQHDWGDWPGLDRAAPPAAPGNGTWYGF